MDFFHAHAPGKPKERAHGPFTGFAGRGEDSSLFNSEVRTMLQRSEGYQRKPHVTSHPSIGRCSGGSEVYQGAEFSFEEASEGVHVVGVAAFPNMGQAQGGATSAANGALPVSMFTTWAHPDMNVVDGGIVARAGVTEFYFRRPGMPQGEGAVNLFPEELPELGRDVNFPNAREVVGGVQPARREAGGPVIPAGAGVEGLVIQQGSRYRGENYGVSKEGEGLVVQDGAGIDPVGGNGDGHDREEMVGGERGLFGQGVSQGVMGVTSVSFDPFELHVTVVAAQEVEEVPV